MTDGLSCERIIKQLIMDNWYMKPDGISIILNYKWTKYIFTAKDNETKVTNAIQWFYDQIMEREGKNDQG